MGQTLSAPVTTKKTESNDSHDYAYAVSEMQGWRVGMEDAHTTMLSLNDDQPNGPADSFFAVFDGHGGSAVAKYSGENVYKRLRSDESYTFGNYPKALKRSFMGTDEDLRADPAFFRDPSGCTAVAALITHDKRIFVANAGDSRCVLAVGGEAKPLSFDHKPDNPEEHKRVQNAGGYIEAGRVCGNLSLSRAIGDFEFKKEYSLQPEDQMITSNPDITEHEITDDDEFLILACDGIWDCLSSQEVVDYVRRSLQQRKTLPEICENIMDHCLAPDSSGGLGMDNMTIMIIALFHGRTMDQWYDWIAKRVEECEGYITPENVPAVYTPQRLALANERRRKAFGRAPLDDEDDDEDMKRNPLMIPGLGSGLSLSGPLSGLARILAGGGTEVSFLSQPGGLRNSADLFSGDSSDEEEDEESSTSQKWPPGSTITNSHRFGAIDELQDEDLDDHDESGSPLGGKGYMSFGGYTGKKSSKDSEEALQGEAPPSPPLQPNDSEDKEGKGAPSKPPQLEHEPQGDAQHPIMKVESGQTLDTSEDPLKAAASESEAAA